MAWDETKVDGASNSTGSLTADEYNAFVGSFKTIWASSGSVQATYGSFSGNLIVNGDITFAGTNIASSGAAGPALLNTSAQATTPTVLPNQADGNTGIGYAGTDQLSLVAGGVEGVRITETGAAISSVDINGPVNMNSNAISAIKSLTLSSTDSGAAGRIYLSNTNGMVQYVGVGAAGSSYDWLLYNGTTSNVMGNPTGTQDIEFFGDIDVAGSVIADNVKIADLLYFDSVPFVLGYTSDFSGLNSDTAAFIGPDTSGNLVIQPRTASGALREVQIWTGSPTTEKWTVEYTGNLNANSNHITNVGSISGAYGSFVGMDIFGPSGAGTTELLNLGLAGGYGNTPFLQFYETGVRYGVNFGLGASTSTNGTSAIRLEGKPGTGNGFMTFTVNNAETMRIYSDGDISVGGAGSSQKFNVQGGGSFTGSVIGAVGSFNKIYGEIQDVTFDSITTTNGSFSGSVSIGGIPTPALRELDVKDSIIITDGTTDAFLFNLDGSHLEWWYQSTYSGGDSGWTQLMHLEGDTGYLGLGTATPSKNADYGAGALIEVAGANPVIQIDGTNNATLQIDRGAATARAEIIYQNAGVNGWFTGLADSDLAGDGTEFFIGTTSGGTSPALWLETTGNVGFGTTSPNQDVEIMATDGGKLRLSRNDTGFVGDEEAGKIEFYSNDTNDTNVNAYMRVYKDDGGSINAPMAITFATGTNGTLGSRLTIRSSGNVGVGNTDPKATFHVSGTGSFSGALNVHGSLTGSVVGMFSEYDNGTVGSAPTIDWSKGNLQAVTLNTSTVTFTFTNPTPVGRYDLRIVGSPTVAVTWPANVLWGSATAPSLTNVTTISDIVTFRYHNGSYFGIGLGSFG